MRDFQRRRYLECFLMMTLGGLKAAGPVGRNMLTIDLRCAALLPFPPQLAMLWTEACLLNKGPSDLDLWWADLRNKQPISYYD